MGLAAPEHQGEEGVPQGSEGVSSTEQYGKGEEGARREGGVCAAQSKRAKGGRGRAGRWGLCS